MNATILHESHGRIRIRLKQRRMTLEQADQLEAWLQKMCIRDRFGSYGWGDGEWMRNWESRCNEDGANLVCDSVICNETPDDDALSACRELGASLI